MFEITKEMIEVILEFAIVIANVISMSATAKLRNQELLNIFATLVTVKKHWHLCQFILHRINMVRVNASIIRRRRQGRQMQTRKLCIHYRV